MELAIRRELDYPPFGRISYVLVSGVDREAVEKNAAALATSLRDSANRVEGLGPAPDILPKARGEFRMRIALKAQEQDAMLEACRLAKAQRPSPDVRMTIIVDPK